MAYWREQLKEPRAQRLSRSSIRDHEVNSAGLIRAVNRGIGFRPQQPAGSQL